MLLKTVTFLMLLAKALAFPLEDERIVNGTDAKLGEIPYIISLRMNNQHVCGGSIINANWVLTAAHCIDGSETYPGFTIQYGVIKISEDIKNSIKVVKVVKHENYRPGSEYHNDVAVLQLASPIPFGVDVQPTKLPPQNQATPALAKALLSGWGRPYTGGPRVTQLQKVDIQVYSDADCEKIHAETGPTNKAYHVCAGVPEGGKGQCNGDSGGPLIANGYQIGIVSWSVKPCTVKGYPGVFAKVSSYVDWINSKIRQ